MKNTEKVREDRVRRMLARQGYQLTRSRRRDPQARDFGCYAIMDWDRGVFVAGAEGDPAQYRMSLDDAEEWASVGVDERIPRAAAEHVRAKVVEAARSLDAAHIAAQRAASEMAGAMQAAAGIDNLGLAGATRTAREMARALKSDAAMSGAAQAAAGLAGIGNLGLAPELRRAREAGEGIVAELRQAAEARKRIEADLEKWRRILNDD
jgi:hypothetical protein